MSPELTPEQVRAHMPFVNEYHYLDNGATTPVPKPVQDAMSEYFNQYGANVERGAYSLAHVASEHWDEARKKAARLLLGCGPDEFVFTSGMTEGANIVAYALEHIPLDTFGGGFGYGDPVVEWKEGDRIVSTLLEHHANILPWMRLAEHVGASFDTATPTPDARLIPDIFEGMVDGSTRLVAFQHVSNAVGTIHDVKAITKYVKARNPDCLVFIDGSQGPGHVPVDVYDIGCDFYAFSGHKGPLGPPGTGGLFVRKELLANMEPMNIGGGIIANVSNIDYKLRSDMPSKKFDAGTPNIHGLIGLGRAAEYVMEEIGIENVDRRERVLARRLIEAVKLIPDVELYGPVEDLTHRGGVVTFNIKGWRSYDVSAALDENWKILTRAGHHCCLPAARWLGILDEYAGNVRASFGYFNQESEADLAAEAIKTLAGGA